MDQPEPHQRNGKLHRRDEDPGADEIGEHLRAVDNQITPHRRTLCTTAVLKFDEPENPKPGGQQHRPHRQFGRPLRVLGGSGHDVSLSRLYWTGPGAGVIGGGVLPGAARSTVLPSNRVRSGSLPSIGETTTIETRRFVALPSTVSLVATGWY